MNSLIAFLKRLWEGFAQLVIDVLTWFVTTLFKLFLQLCELVFDGVVWVMEQIPVPEAFGTLETAWAQLPPVVHYLLYPFEVPAGLSMITGAVVFRFFFRMIPIVGH